MSSYTVNGCTDIGEQNQYQYQFYSHNCADKKMSKLLKIRQFRHVFTRNISEYVKTVEQLTHPPAEGSLKSFKFVTYFVCIPLWLVSIVYCYKKEQEAHHEKPPEFIHYPYMKILNKPFPWGDGKHSLFHNPKRNYIVGVGYEEPVE